MKSYTPPSVIDNKCTHTGRVAALSVWVFNFKPMRTINSKTELAEFFRDELLPYYEQNYSEDLTKHESNRLDLDSGMCWCAHRKFKVKIDGIMDKITDNSAFLFTEIMYVGFSAKESLLPRIEWMKQFIKETL